MEDYEYKFWERGFDIEGMEGCSDEQIIIMKLCQNIDYLPPIYIDFMKRFGGNISKFVNHYWEIGFRQATHNKQYVISDYDADPALNYRLEDDAFVFSSEVLHIYHMYFLTGEQNPDPPVYHIYDKPDRELAAEVFPSLSAFFDAYIKAAGRR